MVITKTPYRISLAGGGTDFPAYYKDKPGACLSFTIDRHCFVSLRDRPPFFDSKSRIVWSKIEEVSATDEIAHPAVRSGLKIFFGDQPTRLELHHDGDLPARSGMGSSAAFTVGLVQAIETHYGRMPDKRQLARTAVLLDQDVTGETVGVQDHFACAYGGVNRFDFGPGDRFDVKVRPVPLAVEAERSLLDHSLLVFTRQARDASDVERAKIARMAHNSDILAEQAHLVDQALSGLMDGDMRRLGAVLTKSWTLKRALSPEVVTNSLIEDWMERIRDCGAYGAKLLGAGGGGCVYALAPPERHARIMNALCGPVRISFRLDRQGASVIYLDRGDESAYSTARLAGPNYWVPAAAGYTTSVHSMRC